MNSKITFLLFTFLLPTIIFSQRITYSEPERDDYKTLNFEVIGKIGGNFLVYKNIRNKNAVSVFDKTTGQVEVSILMKAFEFKKALMQEHFNENYIESDKFPKSVFKGAIGDLSKVDFTKDGKYLASVSGKLSMHGETKDVTAPVTFTVNNGMITATSELKIMLEDYKILIPSLVKDKISKEVRVVIDINYEPLNH